MKTPLTILGMMTGTSCDGLDASCIRFEQNDFRVLWSERFSYPQTLKQRVLNFQKPGSAHTSFEWLKLQRDLGKWYGTVAKRALQRHRGTKVDAIANHGQTVAHFPAVGSLQMGDPAVIAEITGITVISNFRTGDMAAGGQGAPLVPAFHRLLAHSLGADHEGCAIHNLGGISNLTYVHVDHPTLAWDTGPANLWMDAIAQHYSSGKSAMDPGGKWAARGKPHLRAVEKLLSHSYFKKRPPKSTGRDEFQAIDVLRAVQGLSLEDALATATLVTARSIAHDYHRFILRSGKPLSSILFCGGGSQNRTLTSWISRELLELGWLVEVRDCEELGVKSQDMESAAFAFLGRESLLGYALGGTWTGARRFGPPGQLTPGKNWASLLQRLQA